MIYYSETYGEVYMPDVIRITGKQDVVLPDYDKQSFYGEFIEIRKLEEAGVIPMDEVALKDYKSRKRAVDRHRRKRQANRKQ